MHKKKSVIFSVSLILILFSTSGCIKVNSNKTDTSGVDGGVFKTVNRGDIWQQKVLIPTTTGAPRNFRGVNNASFALDPSDNQALYYGSIANGLMYTYDGGENWSVVNSLGKATINDVAVDPSNKCVIYASFGNKIFKSIDCNRTWKQVYFDNDIGAEMSDIEIDSYDTENIYSVISRGEIIKSEDGGNSWKNVFRPEKKSKTSTKEKAKDILLDPNDSRIIYSTTVKNQVNYSKDGGATWEDFSELNKDIKDLKLSASIKKVHLLKNYPDIIFVVTYYGILKSDDKGATWKKIELIPPEKNATINDMVASPANPDELYYVTDTTFYRSLDGGVSWTPKKLPTSRSGWRLIVDPEKTNVIYMTVRALKKK